MVDGRVLQKKTNRLGAVRQKLHFKDEILDEVAKTSNVAQFTSFGPDLAHRFSRIRGVAPNYRFGSVTSEIQALLDQSCDKSVNIRSFHPELPKGRSFIYGIKDIEEVCRNLREPADEGLYTIVNETVDLWDGGVSGVILGNIIEFAPQDTPRCVDKQGVASLERTIGLSVLETVYGFHPAIDFLPHQRVEFSIHPIRRGFRNEHTIIWEVEEVDETIARPPMDWPNRFSKFIGDKVYGLLVAHALGLPVPRTTVLARHIPPYHFGVATGTGETWIRTSPTEQQPGYFTTEPFWTDPFELLQNEDPDRTNIASVLAQEGVETYYSGAFVTTESGAPLIEGVKGTGKDFMVGGKAPEDLPLAVLNSVRKLHEEATGRIGPVRMEWVYDGFQTWVIQMHLGHEKSFDRIIVPGDADLFHDFKVTDGIERLRELVQKIGRKPRVEGILLVGDVGITGHFGDILRQSGIPSRIDRSPRQHQLRLV